MLLFTASESAPHYRLVVTIVIPIQTDGRGRSTFKTEKLINAVDKLTTYQLISKLWGEAAYLANAVSAKTDRSICGGGNVIKINVPAPIDFDSDRLIKQIEKSWMLDLGMKLDGYIECHRHYTVEEELEHVW